jgi:hypothetical protein
VTWGPHIQHLLYLSVVPSEHLNIVNSLKE